jgi:hypothetical protein
MTSTPQTGPFDVLRAKLSPGQTFVLRENVKIFTDGLIDGKTLANLAQPAARDLGRPLPPPHVKIGHRAAYNVDILIGWLNDRNMVKPASQPVKRPRKGKVQ